MSEQPLAITAIGMVTGVGLDAPSTCAAIRAGIDNFQETRFMDSGGEWIQGCEVVLEKPWRGVRKLAKMLAKALLECANRSGTDLSQIPIVVCLAEPERCGRFENLGPRVFQETQEELKIAFHKESRIVEHGRVGGIVAMNQARAIIYEKGIEEVVIAGVDSLLAESALNFYEEQERVQTSQNSNGFIPGEAASAILVEKPKVLYEPQLICLGLGFGVENASIDSEEPLRADGLVAAIRESLSDAGANMEDMDFRIVDISGEHFWFKESSLALLRTLHTPKEEFDIWHPADCIGEVGASIGPAIMAVLKNACDQNYSKGNNILCHFSNNNGKRGSSVLTYRKVETA